jgi:hypothetical protein
MKTLSLLLFLLMTTIIAFAQAPVLLLKDGLCQSDREKIHDRFTGVPGFS